jgi:competence protein ComGC
LSKVESKSRRGLGRADCHPFNIAFTLVELLVVIAVLALLAVLIFPFLSNARENQYDVACRHNLGQLIPSVLVELDNSDWMHRANATGLIESLRCPKGHFENGGSQALNVSGSITELKSRPPSVVPNEGQESNTTIFGFMEQEGYVLPGPLAVDITKPGNYGRSQAGYGSSSGTIAAGTPVDCFYLIYDPSSNGSITNGSVTLSAPIIGVIVQTKTLDKTDPVIGRKDMKYPVKQNARGFEKNAEEIQLTADMKTLNIVSFRASFPGEHVRIITRAGGMGSGSYGLNGMVDHTQIKPDQILMAEYGSSIIYPTSSQHEDTLDRLCDEDRLHFGRINVGLISGKVMGIDSSELEHTSRRWYPD